MLLQEVWPRLVNRVADVPEPQVGLGKRRTQRLGGCNRNKPLAVSYVPVTRVQTSR